MRQLNTAFPFFNLSIPRIRILHYSWFAFFVTFVIWFTHASLMPTLKVYFSMTDKEVKALLMLNVALTIPARLLIGNLVDRYGPRISYSLLLVISGVLCLLFAMAQTFHQLAVMRFLLGFVGAGFVVGIRLISEWFPAKEVGFAEGIYGGWGNFGASVATMLMPFLAFHVFGGEDGWRAAIATTGILALVYSVIFYRNVRDTPEGGTYFRAAKSGGLEVTSKKDMYLYFLMSAPLYCALWIMAWRLSPTGLQLLSATTTHIAYAVIAGLAVYQYSKMWQVNKHLFTPGGEPEHQYQFKQVAILCLAYMACFGSELAVISMLPQYIADEYGISKELAGMVAGCFAVMNILARPGGGFISDWIGRRKALFICLAGQTVGYFMLAHMNQGLVPLVGAVLMVLLSSIFVQGACGAVYSIVPLVQRRMTGQIAGIVGAYGNVGGVVFLTIFSFTNAAGLFYVLAGVSLVVLVISTLISEPKGHMIEVHADGRIERISVE